MDKSFEMSATPENIEKAIRYIDEALTDRKIPSKKKTKTILIAEETVARMVENADEDSVLVIEGRGVMGNLNLRLRSKGSPFDIDDIENHLLFDGSVGDDEEMNEVVHNLVQKLFWNKLSLRHNKGANIAQIHVAKSNYSGIVSTFLALAIGILLGIILKAFTPEDFSAASVKYVFDPVFTVLMNALKMMIAPLVFCSIASSIADFSDLRSLGKIAIKLVIAYFITSMIAVGVGYVGSFLLPQGNPDLVKVVGDQASDLISTGQTTDVSIIGTIVSIVPLDIITPFQKSEMLQLIFLAVIIGVTGASMANRYPNIRTTLSTLNNLCSTIITFIVKFVPVMVVCSMVKMMISLDAKALSDVVSCIPANYIGCFLMIIVYMLLLLVVGRINPFKFIKKFFPAMLMAFSTNSSNAALPTSLECCNKLGVSKRISSFSLPLGATINMDGFCVTLIILTYFIAGIYGVPIEGSTLTTLLISIVALSIGCPGIPGAGMVCMTILLPQIGIPAESVALIMGIYPFIGMIMTATNVTGDAVVTTIISKQAKMLNMKKYNK